MKLLLDENLSRRMVPLLQTAFPGTSQAALLGLERAADRAVWTFAKTGGFVIVTSDSDFEELSLLYGAPPHVVRIKSGNLSNREVVALLTAHAETIRNSIENDGRACVELY